MIQRASDRADSLSVPLAKLTEPLSSETAFAVKHILADDSGVHLILHMLDFQMFHFVLLLN